MQKNPLIRGPWSCYHGISLFLLFNPPSSLYDANFWLFCNPTALEERTCYQTSAWKWNWPDSNVPNCPLLWQWGRKCRADHMRAETWGKKNSKMLTSPFSLAFVQRPILLEKPLWGVWIVECVLRSVNLCCDVNALIDHRSQRRWKRSHKETLKSSKTNNN